MTDKPIPFSGPMIRALLDGRKTQDRQILKPQPPEGMTMYRYYGEDAPRPDLRHTFGWMVPEAGDLWPRNDADRIVPKYAVGDRLWVREEHYLTDDGESEYAVFADDDDAVAEHLQDMQTVMAVHPDIDWSKHLRLRPSIHMPRWASRLTLIVTDVRVQRVQEINEADAIAEGCRPFFDETNPEICTGPNGFQHEMAPLKGPTDDFHRLWNSLHGQEAWDANPWVAAYTFTVHRCNIDQMSDKKASDH